MAKYYYNGVLLPKVPVVEEYPFVAIRYDEANNRIDCVYSQTILYYDGSTIGNVARGNYKRFIANMSNPEKWNESTDTNYSSWTITTNRKLLWSSHNVPNGSATSTGIYLYSNHPLPEADEYYCNDVLLPKIPTDVLAQYPYVWIRDNKTTGQYQLIMSSKGFYFKDNALNDNYGVISKQYNITIGDTSTTTWVDANNNMYSSWGLDANRTILWSNHDIPNGSTIVTEIYFNGSEPVPEGGSSEPEEPDVPSRTSGYLIQSGGSLFTVTDGVLTAVKGSVNADLFRTYGVDNIPASELLVTLTDPVVLYWVDTTEYEIKPLVAVEQAVPPVQTVESPDYDMTHSSIVGIEKVLVDASDDVRFAISFDSGQTWYTHTGQAWGILSEADTGMSASIMSAITTEDWNSIATTGKFRFRLTIPSVDSCLNSLIVDYLN